MSEHRARRLRQVSGPPEVLSIWEGVVGKSLAAERRDEFLTRPEIADLAQLSVGLLETAASMTFASEGRVLLSSWLAIVPRARDAMPENKRPRERAYGQGAGLGPARLGGIASIF